MIPTIASRVNRVLRYKVPLRPIFAVVLLALVYAIWFPTINAACNWRPHQIANFAGHDVNVPFLWYEDSQANFTLRHPGPSIVDLLDDSIEMTRTLLKSPAEAANFQRRWLYINELGPKPAQEDEERSARDEQFRQLMAPLGEYKLTPNWSCAKFMEPTKPMIRLECLSKDSTYILRYNGRPAYLEEFKRVAEQIEGPKTPQHIR